MEPRDLLQALMDRAGENSNSLAAKLNGRPSQPQIHKFLTGKAREPRRGTLEPLAAHFGVPLDAFYDAEVAELVMRERGLPIRGHAVEEPLATYSPAPPPSPMELRPEILQLLRDLDDLAPSRASKFIDAIHQAAEEAREAARHHALKRGKVSAERREVVKRTTAAATWGDGNDKQASLPLATVKDPFTAAPSDRESSFYRRIERTPKK